MKKPTSFTFLPTEKDKLCREHYKSAKIFSLWDIIILLVILVVVVTLLTVSLLSDNGGYAEVYLNGELIKTINLDKDAEITLSEVDEHIKLMVRDGAIAISQNDCASQTCVKMGYINKSGQRIVCAPKHLLVIVKDGKEKGEYDGVTGGIQ